MRRHDEAGDAGASPGPAGEGRRARRRQDRPRAGRGGINLDMVARGLEEADELRGAGADALDEADLSEGAAAADSPVAGADDVDEAELEAISAAVAAKALAEEAGAEVADDEAGGDEGGDAAGAPSEAGLRAAVEAVVFAAEEPVTPSQVAKAVEARPRAVRRALADIGERCEREGSGLALVELAGGYTFVTREEFAPAIRRLRKSSGGRKLTSAAVETLAVVAYKQPVQKAEIEAVRGVGVGPMLRTLMEAGLVTTAGRADVLGRPLLYATTRKFQDAFGLASLKDLPTMKELQSG